MNKNSFTPSSDKLAIFYSKNNDKRMHPIINLSLKTIEIAAKDKVDVITCMWEPQGGNPFYECISYNKTGGFLNIVLQILQCLYTARLYKNYEYVSFLEHDLLYAEEYFDYPDFKFGVMANTNYIGMSKNGYELWNGGKEITGGYPFQQMTMIFDDAIKYFEKLLPGVILMNAGSLEPIGREKYLVYEKTKGYFYEKSDIEYFVWKAKNSNIHINHTFHHFTNHCTKFSNNYEYDEYWGHFEKYKYLFEVE